MEDEIGGESVLIGEKDCGFGSSSWMLDVREEASVIVGRIL